MLSTLVIGIWSAFSTALVLCSIKIVINIRLSLSHELRGADYVEHNTSFETSDDTLLPQSNGIKKSKKSYVKRRLKKVLNALKATHRFSTYSKKGFLKRQVKENQTKTLAVSWPTVSSSTALPV
jgi:hypothetical protein